MVEEGLPSSRQVRQVFGEQRAVQGRGRAAVVQAVSTVFCTKRYRGKERQLDAS